MGDIDDTHDHGAAENAGQVVRLTGPADLLGVLPYRLGFHPTESLVLLCLHGPRRRDRLVMRLDLCRSAQDRQVAAELAERVAHVGATAVVAVVYTEATAPRNRMVRAGLVRALRRALAARSVALPEALLVRDGRWWSYLCRSTSCCPAEGTRIPAEPTPAATRFAAEVVGQGDAVLPDRSALRRSVEPSGHPVAREVRRQAVLASGRELVEAVAAAGVDGARALVLGRLAALRRAWCEHASRPGPQDASLVVLGLAHKPIRDEAMTAVLDPDADSLVGLLTALARQADDAYAAGVCTVLAWVAYARGDGALAVVAAERALRAEPGYPMAELLLDAIDRMIPPAALREVSLAVRTELTGQAG